MSSLDRKTHSLKRRRSSDTLDEWPVRNYKRVQEMEKGVLTTPSASSPTDFYDPSQQEIILQFDRIHITQPTPLLSSLRTPLHPSLELSGWLEELQYAQRHLGNFGADLALQDLLRRVNTETLAGLDTSDIQNIKQHDCQLPPNWQAAGGNLLSPKLLRLIEVLKSYGPLASRFQGILYVNRRSSAPILACILSKLSDHLKFLRPCCLLGSSDPSDIPAEVETLRNFKTGVFNLIVVARSAEDLDLPTVPLLVHYDSPPNGLSYAYCRTQTQPSSGRMIFMVESGCSQASRNIYRLGLLDEEAYSWIESTRDATTTQCFPPREFCHTPPTTSRSDPSENQKSSLGIQDPTTGLAITPSSSTLAIYRYAQDLHGQRASELCSFVFQEQTTGDGFGVICTIIIPGSSVPTTVGPPSPSYGHARRSATYQTCLHLFQAGALDSWVFPALDLELVGPNIPSSDADNDVADHGPARRYPRRHPLFWTEVLPIHATTTLYPTLIAPSPDCSITYSPIILLTTHPLPRNLGTDPRIYGSYVPSVARLIPAAPLALTAEDAEKLFRFSSRAYHAVLRKTLSLPLEEVLYLLAPLKPSDELYRTEMRNVQDCIAWDIVEEAAEGWAVPFYKDDGQFSRPIEDAILADSWTEFTRRYHQIKPRTDLSPRSPPAHGEFGEEYQSYLEFCEKQRKDFPGLKNPNQPLIEVTDLPPYSNNLSPLQKDVVPATRCFIPELCAMFTIPAGTFRTLNLVPAVTHHIDQLLLVKELNARYFARAISDKLLLQAVTTPTALQGYDYERLEWLGDSFLKYFSSCFVFTVHPENTEGQLHAIRGSLISNNTLFLAANRIKIPPFIQAASFILRTWKPALSTTSRGTSKPPVDRPPEDGPKKRGKKRKAKDPDSTVLGDKVVANVVEAIIGAAFLTGGRDVALTVVKALDLPFPNVYRWADVSPVVPSSFPVPLQAKQRDAITVLTGFTFDPKSPWLSHALSRGTSHASSLAHERLEFIGDAILDFMVICYLYDKYPSMATGGLTLLKGASVSNSALAAISASIGLQEHARFPDPRTTQKVAAYVTAVGAQKVHERQKAALEQRELGQYWIGIEAPKPLADVLEALIGAIYFSDGCELQGVQRFFDRVLRPFYDQYVTLHTLSDHPNTALIQVLQSYPCQQLRLETELLGQLHHCQVLVHDIVLAHGEANTAASASRWACSSALDALEGDPNFLPRTCDCRQGNPGPQPKKGGKP